MFTENINETERKKIILNGLISQIYKEDVQIDEYVETIDFLESEDAEEIRNLFGNGRFPTLTECCWLTLVCIGPVGMLFIHIFEKRLEVLPLNAVLALVSVSIITVVWKEYFSARKIYKQEMKEKNICQVKIWPFMILSFILAFTVIVAVTIKAEKWLAPEQWLFYEMSGMAEACMVLIMVLIGVSCCVINVTYVSNKNIVVHTLLHPNGIKYKYDDIEKVEARFGTKIIALSEANRRGEFTYKIHLEDRVIVFAAPSTNETIERYNENTYLELEELDQKLMEMGIVKEASKQYSEYCELDEEYVDRFIRIIENKSNLAVRKVK